MFDKLEITGTITLETGMHIGTIDGFSAIGAIDSYVVRDILSNEPMIPGSSFKGKMRSLLARKYAKNPMEITLENEDDRIKRLFGTSASKTKGEKITRGKLLFSDMFLSNKEGLEKLGIKNTTEVKMENVIDRLSSIANPRSIERAIRGAEFDLILVYDLIDINQLQEDIEIIMEGFRLLEADYLGGNGSRGYGRIKIDDIHIESLLYEVDDELLDELNEKIMK